MQDRLDTVRQFFPAEATGAYLAIQGIITSQGVGRSERDWQMLILALVLASINAWIYWYLKNLRFDNRKSIGYHAVIALGFMLWVFNIDMARFVDIPLIGPHIEILAPTALVLYTLITGIIGFPTEAHNENG